MRNTQPPRKILDEALANGVGSSSQVSGFRHLLLEVSMTGFTGTLKMAGSFLETLPDFSAAKSVSNPFDTVQIKDLQDNASINGDTGISGSNTTDVRLFEVNTNGLKWLNGILSGVTGGTITVRSIPFND